MSLPDILSIAMFISVCAVLMGGVRVAFALGGIGLIFAAIGAAFGVFDTGFLLALAGRIYPLITRDILMAVPLFVFMGVMLEKSRLAEDLLEAMGDLFGPMRGGLGVSVILVGALLAASTGIVGATVVTMGLLSLPTMLSRGYSPSLSSGAIAASGTLGQIIPPSIVLVILGDQLSNAYQEAQRSFDLGPDALVGGGVVSVGDLFAGALIPGLILVALYALYIFTIAYFKPSTAPAVGWPEGVTPWRFIRRIAIAMLPPIILIIAVLGSILTGYATPTRGAALGALGAVLLAAYKLNAESPLLRRAILAAALGTIILIAVDLLPVDIRLSQDAWTMLERACALVALLGFAALAIGTLMAMLSLVQTQHLGDVSRTTMHITSMVFLILIGATIFTLVFRGLGGDDLVAHALSSAPGGAVGALMLVMVVMFLLGFFLDFIEITFVVVPLVAPALLAMQIAPGVYMDPVWLGILMALNLQTSFLTPPFGFALFYLRGVAPPEVTTPHIYRGVLPFIAIQIIVIGLVGFFPELATALVDGR